MPRRDRWTRLGLWLAVAAAAALFFQLYAWERMNDLRVYYAAAERIIAGENIYAAADGFYQYKYTPLLAVALAPLTLLPPKLAGLLWIVASALLLVACVRQVRALVPSTSGGWLRLLLPLAFFHHITRELELGQVNLLCFFLLLQVVRRPTGRAAGPLLAAATLIKPVYAIFALAWLLARDGRRLGVYALALAAGLALALPFWGGDTPAYLYSGLRNLVESTGSAMYDPDNQSLWGAAFRFFSSHGDQPALLWDLGSTAALSWSVFALCAAMLGGTLWTARGLYAAPPPGQPQRALGVTHYSLLVVLMLLFSPLGWHYTQLQLLLPVMLLLERDRRFRQLAPVYLLILFSILMPFELLRRTLYYGLLTVGLKTVGALLVWWRLLRLAAPAAAGATAHASAAAGAGDGAAAVGCAEGWRR